MDKANAVRAASIPLAMILLSCTSILGIDKDYYEETGDSSSPASTGSATGGGHGGAPTTSAGGFGGATSSAGGGEGGAGVGGGGSGGGFPCTGDDEVFEDPATGHCYRRFTSNENWLNARAQCQVWGGSSADLAAVSAQSEYEFIVSELGATFEMWVGARDFDPKDAAVGYEWSNGEPWGYSPNGNLPVSNPLESCARLKNDAFQPRSCGQQYGFLCERY